MPNNAPHNALRHHVSGAVARGEAAPIVAVDPVKRGPAPLSRAPRWPISARTVAVRALASRGNTLRPAGVLIPETPREARAEYVAARERSETVPAALSRARAEIVAAAVLSWHDHDDREDGPAATDALDAYNVNPRELASVTGDPRYATLAGERRDATTGELILSPVDLPDGAKARVYVYDDDNNDVTGECYDDGSREAFGESWAFVGVTAVVTLADGRQGEASLWGIERGDYWPGSDAAQLWPHIPDLIREAARYADNSRPDPENIPESDEPPAENLAAWMRGIVDELDPEGTEHDENHDPDAAGTVGTCAACWGDRIREVLDAYDATKVA